MNTLLLVLVALTVVMEAVQGYGYHNKSKKSIEVPVIKDNVIKKDPVIIPEDNLPMCSVGCNRRFISPDCRQETFGFENGLRCRGCPIDICRNTWTGVDGDPWDVSGLNGDFLNNGGFDSLDNRGLGSEFNSWVNGDLWQNRRGLSGTLGDNSLLNGNQWNNRRGFGGNFEDPLIGRLQSGRRDQRFGNRFSNGDGFLDSRL